MDCLSRGYTNKCRMVGEDRVSKTYLGKGAQQRCRAEGRCLESLAGFLPVPRLVSSTSIEMGYSHPPSRLFSKAVRFLRCLWGTA